DTYWAHQHFFRNRWVLKLKYPNFGFKKEKEGHGHKLHENEVAIFKGEKGDVVGAQSEAAYTVGGHSFSAAVIEYVILKMKPPVHRPQIALLLALHKLKVSDEQKDLAVNSFEPLVVCALSCGMYSSPAIRIYTAKNVKDELQEAQHDFIRASVGVSSKGKLLVPKMIHSFAKGFVDDEKLAVWISHYLPSQQAAFVEKCMSKRRQSILSSRNCGIVPFDSRFRYLFLPEKSLPC
ncbi:unnamed protein product, partial [Ilex paraguariensis]